MDFEKKKVILLVVLVFLIGILLALNLKLSQLEKEKLGQTLPSQPVYFQTSGGFKIRCPLAEQKDCLNARVKSYPAGGGGLIFKVKEGTAFVSVLEGEISYVRAGFGEDLKTAIWYPSLTVKDKQGREARYIFSGEALPNLWWVKEGEVLGKLGLPIAEDGGDYNLSIWVEKEGKRLEIYK